MTTNGGNDGFLTGGYRVVADPAAGQPASVTVTTNNPVLFTAGAVYTFKYDWAQYSRNSRALVFNLLVNNLAVAGSTIDTKGTAGSNPRSVTYTAATTGCYPVSLSFVFGSQSGSSGDDIDITNLTRSPA